MLPGLIEASVVDEDAGKPTPERASPGIADPGAKAGSSKCWRRRADFGGPIDFVISDVAELIERPYESGDHSG